MRDDAAIWFFVVILTLVFVMVTINLTDRIGKLENNNTEIGTALVCEQTNSIVVCVEE